MSDDWSQEIVLRGAIVRASLSISVSCHLSVSMGCLHHVALEPGTWYLKSKLLLLSLSDELGRVFKAGNCLLDWARLLKFG